MQKHAIFTKPIDDKNLYHLEYDESKHKKRKVTKIKLSLRGTLRLFHFLYIQDNSLAMSLKACTSIKQVRRVTYLLLFETLEFGLLSQHYSRLMLLFHFLL